MTAKQIARDLRILAGITAVNSVTLTPLLGFVVGDHRPSVLATLLTLLVAVVMMGASLAARTIERRRPAPLDVAAARRQSHDMDLPFVESDGAVSWPERKRTAEDVHRELHARRWEAERRAATSRPGSHMSDCRCERAFGPRGVVILSEDSRCKVLRQGL